MISLLKKSFSQVQSEVNLGTKYGTLKSVSFERLFQEETQQGSVTSYSRGLRECCDALCCNSVRSDKNAPLSLLCSMWSFTCQKEKYLLRYPLDNDSPLVLLLFFLNTGQGLKKLQTEIATFEKQKTEELERLEQFKEEELKKLRYVMV